MAETLALPVDLMEVPTDRGFRIGLYLEHLEEAAAMWEQRPADRLNPDLSWLDLAADEDRAEAHLDALVVGGDLALAVCRQQAVAGDPGELHAALRVFCRQNRPDLVETAIGAIDPDDALALDAITEALVAEMPEAWETGVWRTGRIEDPRWLPLGAGLVAHRARPGREALLRVLPHAEGAVRPLVVRALGRTTDGIAEHALADLLRDDDPAVRLEAGVALLRAGTPSGQAAALPAVRGDDALLPLLGLAGRASAVAWLRSRLGEGLPDVATALGLLGDPSAVPDLIRALGLPEPEPAALALYTITGADLRVESFVPDVPGDDELFGDERERRDAGEPPEPLGAADPRGTTVVEISTDPEAWTAWWTAGASAFTEGTRYRLGWPAGPASQVASLAAPTLPHALRGLIADELTVRYRMALAFDTMWSVARQQAAIGEMRAWAESQAFVPGRGYVGGQYAGQGR